MRDFGVTLPQNSNEDCLNSETWQIGETQNALFFRHNPQIEFAQLFQHRL